MNLTIHPFQIINLFNSNLYILKNNLIPKLINYEFCYNFYYYYLFIPKTIVLS